MLSVRHYLQFQKIANSTLGVSGGWSIGGAGALCSVTFHIFLHCPLNGPVLIYISLLIISCIIEYVTNKRTLNLNHHGVLKVVNMNGNILQRDILLIKISRGANNCVQRVFEKKHLFHNDISPHFKFLLYNERLDFLDFLK